MAEPATISTVVAHKRLRKPSKNIFKQICQQMEFYFSDANLNKDRFLKKEIEETSDGYVDLEKFLKFNKIRALTSDVEVIRKALAKSKPLELSEDLTKVRRVVKFSVPKDVDDRTIYVECIPAGVNHEWVKNAFNSCGQVLYVSLPKFKSTGDLKGFAFVEFATAEAAVKACQTMNNPPVSATDAAGIFPRGSKAEKQLVKQVLVKSGVKQGRKRRASESMMENNERDMGNKNASIFKRSRTRSFSVGEKAEDDSTKVDGESLERAGNDQTMNDKSNTGSTGRDDVGTKSSLKSVKDGKKPIKLKSKRRSEKDALRRANSTKGKKIKLDTAAICEDVITTVGAGNVATEDIVVQTISKDNLKEVKVGGSDNTEDIKVKVEGDCAGDIVRSESQSVDAGELGVESKRRKRAKENETEMDNKSNIISEESGKEDAVMEFDKTMEKSTTEKPSKRKKSREQQTGDKDMERDSKRIELGRDVDVRKSSCENSAEASEIDTSTKEKKERKRHKQTGKHLCSDVENETVVKKRRVEEEDKSDIATTTIESSKDSGVEKLSTEKHKRRQKKNKKTRCAKDIPELRVISKSDWLERKAEYLALQKANMSRLKETLRQLDQQRTVGSNRSRDPTTLNKAVAPVAAGNIKTSSIEFVPGVIVKLTSATPTTRKDITTSISDIGDIAYVDVLDGSSEAHVRCANVETAQKLVTASVTGLLSVLLTGSEEEAYWKKLAADRERKLEQKTRPKRRGRDKILQRADIYHENAVKNKHIIFE